MVVDDLAAGEVLLGKLPVALSGFCNGGIATGNGWVLTQVLAGPVFNGFGSGTLLPASGTLVLFTFCRCNIIIAFLSVSFKGAGIGTLLP